ncbi:MAG: UvrD-helicase domain-containing protein [Woeseia sp.]
MDVDASRLEADRRARVDALDVSRSFIVQAPAGSGKTELLIERYLKLLAQVDHPEEVVAITFTRKAAQEMQLRAIAAMRAAKSGATADEAHQRLTLDVSRKVLERDREKDWQLLESPQRMRIQTLDALNAGIARSLPFSSGPGGSGKIVTDDEMQQLYRMAASATLDWLLTEGETNDAVELVLTHLDNNTSVYVAYLARMLATRDQWLVMIGAGPGSPAADANVRTSLERNIAELVSGRLSRVRRLLPEEQLPLLTELCRYAGPNLTPKEKSACAVLADCEEFPPADAGHVDVWRAIAALLLTQSGRWRKSVNRNDGFPPRDEGQKQQMLDLLRLFAEHPQLGAELHRVRQLPDVHYTDDQWAVLLALFRLLPAAVAELQRIFSERGVTDHTEVALAAAAALGNADDPGDIGLLLDYTIRHLLIDEMQDTSIAQYRLIERLVAGWEPGDGRTLFCVGDPMQSIYRFRDAEVGQFLLARENGIGPVILEPLLLRQNFRSGERLVHWFNSVFEQILPIQDDIAAGAIAYSASVPAASLSHSSGHSGVATGAYRIYPLFGVSYEEEADFTLAVIRGCVDASEDQSTAVLVRSRTQLPLLLARLRQAQIAYQAIEIDRLTDLPEIIDVLALTRALAHRGDRIAWLGLLRGPWVGLRWSDIHSLVFNDAHSTVWELLHDDARLQALSSDARILLAAFKVKLAPVVAGHGTASLREIVEQAWYLLRGPLLLRNDEKIGNVYRFFDVLEGIDVAGTVYDVAELETRLDQERVSGKSAPGCRLHIMTMHRAKGLQFDHVVVYGLGRTAKGDQKSILSWLNLPARDDGPSMIISPVGARAELEADPLHNFIEATEREKERLETDRLLYVACTRARRSVHLVGHVALSKNGDGFRDPRKGTLLHRLWPTVKGQFAEAFQARAASTDETRAPPSRIVWELPQLCRLKDGCALPALPELPGLQAPEEAAQLVVERQVDFYWVGSIARHAGTILHRWLHRIAAGKLRVEGEPLGRLAPVGRNWAKELGVPMRDLDAVCDRALLALRGIVDDEKGRWILSGDGFAELPVTGVWNNGVESIVIDRVRVDGEGVHWIIDYKASTHEGGDLEGFVKQEADRYRQQLTKYAFLYRNLVADPSITVRTALYFPLLREFCEVVVD